MICKDELCETELKGRQTQFCSRTCQNRYAARHTFLVRRSTTVTGKTCKWCMGSEKGFCCDKHKNQYINLRKAIDSELARSKPEPTEAQLKGYKKLEWVLLNSETLNR